MVNLCPFPPPQYYKLQPSLPFQWQLAYCFWMRGPTQGGPIFPASMKNIPWEQAKDRIWSYLSCLCHSQRTEIGSQVKADLTHHHIIGCCLHSDWCYLSLHRASCLNASMSITIANHRYPFCKLWTIAQLKPQNTDVKVYIHISFLFWWLAWTVWRTKHTWMQQVTTLFISPNGKHGDWNSPPH